VNPYEIALLALVSALAVVALVAVRFPRGRAEWPLEARQTAWLLVSGLTAVIVFVLLYVATRDVRWPDAVALTFAAVSLLLGLLAGVALFLPQGLRARP
jgi:uncharacterized membrane protein